MWVKGVGVERRVGVPISGFKNALELSSRISTESSCTRSVQDVEGLSRGATIITTVTVWKQWYRF